jgi:hypothetical protein
VDTLKWRGDPPRVEILYDSSINYLLKVAFHLNRTNTRLTAEAVHDLFVEDLALAQVNTVPRVLACIGVCLVHDLYVGLSASRATFVRGLSHIYILVEYSFKANTPAYVYVVNQISMADNM